MQNPHWLLCLVIVIITEKGWGLYTLYNTLYIIITSIITKLVGHRCLMWEEINYRITRRRAESGMDAQPLFLIYFFSFSYTFLFWHFLYLSLSISFFLYFLFFLFFFLDAMAYFCQCLWESLSHESIANSSRYSTALYLSILYNPIE